MFGQREAQRKVLVLVWYWYGMYYSYQ
jgi:hypothetical protein